VGDQLARKIDYVSDQNRLVAGAALVNFVVIVRRFKSA
jgi:hypothetical protein